MSETKPVSDEIHRQLAKSLFNQTWDLLDKEERTREEDSKMIHSAHASRYHWGEIGTPLEFERGEWQISRVYSVLKRSEPALYHARLCLNICRENDIGDFDIAFAYEALARAHAVAGDKPSAGEFLALAREAGAKIENEGNKRYFLGELKSIVV